MTAILSDTQTNDITGNKKVLAGGCFDVLHNAHIEFLKRAKDQGDTLVILLESDENIKKIKGEERPVNNQIVRAENLSKLGIADFILLLKFPSPSEYYYNLVKLIHPAIIAVTDDDPLLQVKREQASLVGGDVIVVMKRDPKYSTSSLLQKI